MKTYYLLQATSLPKNHLLCHEKDIAVIGERGRLCLYGEPKLFKSKSEAESFAQGYIKRNGQAFSFTVASTSGPVNLRTGRQLAEDSFVEHNYYLKVVKVPDAVFITRGNIKPLYLRGDLVVGKGSSLAKIGRQLWFQTHENAQTHLQKLMNSPAFHGYLFEVITAK